MKLLTTTTLYPNAAAPGHGVFVENRLDAWRRRSGGFARVIAPVPWFPSDLGVFGRYARYAAAPQKEVRREIQVRHPRYAVFPKVGMNAAPAMLAATFERAAREALVEGFDFDLIDAHYLYPDCVAAVRAARRLQKPVILTARGSDVTLIPSQPRPREMILDAIRRADAVVAVAAALKDDLVRLGAPAEKVTVLRNGVDLDRFRPQDRIAIRQRMKLFGPVIASVGSLIGRKGHDVAIRAIAGYADATLLIVGCGIEERPLKALAAKLEIAERVRFLGEIAHENLPEIYNAADALILASTREGWPNVLLESMACGTPCVTSDAGGCAEVIAAPAAGRIVTEHTATAFALALKDVVATADRDATRRFAAAYSWDETSDGLSEIYKSVTARADRHIRYSPILAASQKPTLIITVDTEEQFDWNEYSPDRFRVSPPRDIDRLQRLCKNFGARPLYLITYPLLVDAECAGYFRTLAEENCADLGIHLHSWTTPPIGGFAGEYYSWQCNLPSDLHEAKLRVLSEAFERAFGFRPKAHRAGRYGISPQAWREIAAVGVDYDFSPSAGFDFSARGGPDFSTMSNNAFTVRTDRGAVHVTPASGAQSLRGARAFLKAEGPPGPSARRQALPRAMTAPLRLTCENAKFDDLVSLTRNLSKSHTPVLAFSLHSTTMTPGGNPYAPDAAAVDASLALVGRYLDFFTKDFGGEIISLPDLAELYGRPGSRDALTGAINLNPPLSASS